MKRIGILCRQKYSTPKVFSAQNSLSEIDSRKTSFPPMLLNPSKNVNLCNSNLSYSTFTKNQSLSRLLLNRDVISLWVPQVSNLSTLDSDQLGCVGHIEIKRFLRHKNMDFSESHSSVIVKFPKHVLNETSASTKWSSIDESLVDVSNFLFHMFVV